MPRKTIYVKDNEIWVELQRRAKKSGYSVSEFLIKAGMVFEAGGVSSENQLDRIESKLDMIVGMPSLEDAIGKELIEDVIIPPKTWRDTDYEKHEQNAIDHPPHALGDSPVESTDYVDRTTRGDMAVPRSDDEVLREAQDKLEKIQASRGYFNPQPKKGK